MAEQLGAAVCQRADGIDAQVTEDLHGALADIEQRVDRQRPHNLAEVRAVDDGDGVRLFEVAAELGNGFVEGDTDRHGEPGLAADALTQKIGDVLPAPEQLLRAGHIQPALVDAERLDKVGILTVNGVDLARIAHIEVVMRAHKHEVRALFLRLVDGLRGDDALPLGKLVFGEDDAVAFLRLAADRHRDIPQRGVQHRLDRRKKSIQVRMQHHSVRHGFTSRK